MNVPPLCTVAVSASAHAPSPRLPRKNPSRKCFLSIVRCASVPSQTEAAMNTSSTHSTELDWAAEASGIPGLPQLVDVQPLFQLVVLHAAQPEPDGEDCAQPPRQDDAPEDPVREAQHEGQAL